jgi:hypothetical protein
MTFPVPAWPGFGSKPDKVDEHPNQELDDQPEDEPDGDSALPQCPVPRQRPLGGPADRQSDLPGCLAADHVACGQSLLVSAAVRRWDGRPETRSARQEPQLRDDLDRHAERLVDRSRPYVARNELELVLPRRRADEGVVDGPA